MTALTDAFLYILSTMLGFFAIHLNLMLIDGIRMSLFNAISVFILLKLNIHLNPYFFHFIVVKVIQIIFLFGNTVCGLQLNGSANAAHQTTS